MPEQNPIVTQMRELLLQLLGPQEIEGDSPSPIIAMPKGVALFSLEGYQPAPTRIRGRTVIHDYRGFIDYVNAYKSVGARVFVNPEPKFAEGQVLATAYLDFPEPGKPAWTTHIAEFRVQPSLEYKQLLALDGLFLAQDDFARRVNDLARIVTSMDGAALLELAQSLTLSAKGDFRSITDDLSGSANFVYDVKVSASAGTAAKKVEVPSTFGFNAPVLLDGDKFPILADFMYRIPEEAGGKVKLGIRMPDRKYLERDVLQAAAASIAQDTSLPVTVGNSNVPEADTNDAQITAFDSQ